MRLSPWVFALASRFDAREPPPPGLLHLSDPGVQYAATDFRGLAAAHGLTLTISRTANPYDGRCLGTENTVVSRLFRISLQPTLNRAKYVPDGP